MWKSFDHGGNSKPTRRLASLLLVGLSAVGTATARTDGAVNALRGEAHGVSLTVTPLTRGQKTGFFVARGFTAEQVSAYAQTCGFSFAFENRERAALKFHLANWTVESGGRILRFLPPRIFDRDWEQQGIDKSARIAFLWAQFPAEQEFARGDWIMGMANLMERPAGRFRIVARFDEGGKTLELPVDNVACAPLD